MMRILDSSLYNMSSLLLDIVIVLVDVENMNDVVVDVVLERKFSC